MLLDQEPEISEEQGALPLPRAMGEFEFRGVSFWYEGSRHGIDDISFHVPSGTRVGIVGATGAGKTTLLNLLMRFYDPSEGAVLLDGIGIQKYRIADLRRQFGVVLQEPVLFAASIAEKPSDQSAAPVNAAVPTNRLRDSVSLLCLADAADFAMVGRS